MLLAGLLQSILTHSTMSQSIIWKNNCGLTQDDDGVNFCGDSETRNVKFKVINYIPSRYHPKYLWYVAISFLVTILLITIIAVFSSRSTDGSIDRYWVENLFDGSRIVAQTTESRKKVLLQERRFKPNAVVFDDSSANFYATDDNAGLLIAMNVHSGHFLILLADLIRPRDVVLDSNEGLVFVLQHSYSIVRANMDGSKPVEIVSKNGTTALSIDSTKKRLYWINDFFSIESSDYEGKNRRTVVATTTKITTLTVSDNNLYWIERNERDDVALLLSCNMNTDVICEKRVARKIGSASNVTSIRSYLAVNRTAPSPCELSNGGCEQLCLVGGRNRSSCACRMGWQLNANGRTCDRVRDFVIYPYDAVVRTCLLDGSRELFWPTPYSVNRLAVKTEIDFEYDLKNDYFYFSDDHHIHRMKLKSYAGQEVILSVNSSDLIIDDIAYDWFTGNMYYGQRHVDATLEHSLVVFNTRLGEIRRKSIKIFDQDDFKARSYALALHPGRGYLFVAVTHEDERDTHVFRSKLNGTDFTRSYHFYAEGMQDHRFFAIDYESDRVYAIQESGEIIWIVYVKIQSTGMQFPEHPNFAHARTVAVHQRWLYLSSFSRICRFDKETGEDPFVIAPRVEDPAKKITGVRIASEEIQFTGSDNPCADNNGGCEQFCFSGSKATCDCTDGQKVNDHGRCYVSM
ncbi:low-density lipoprotein receptor-related protein 6-like isoform X2 [Phymastichus coffea]|uniref:low-density lipoprotein receptor-related protein 6-like isoform X2 n=1 Tax=Phymastichus coffea TaxID=108790 RepID=UPI00273C0FB3|nr:low-density lipoprotein receptor-related protein 6-like isoform X2 [Phymastichus coffea]